MTCKHLFMRFLEHSRVAQATQVFNLMSLGYSSGMLTHSATFRQVSVGLSSPLPNPEFQRNRSLHRAP